MNILLTPAEVRFSSTQCRLKNLKIGFVPTMGYLHEGHMSLLRRARLENDVVVVSIFVNPTQFEGEEEYQSYPRNPARDRELVESLADVLFCPDAASMYPSDERISFRIGTLTKSLCGPFRPGHFEGVLQILTKFFHCVLPSRVYLGQKDYQQSIIARHLVQTYFFDTEVVICPTVRASDGLALSSRNARLNTEERRKAPALYEALLSGESMLRQGEQRAPRVLEMVRRFLQRKGVNEIEYIDLCDARTLEKVERISGQEIVLGASIFLGNTRLIDNLLFTPHAPSR